MPIAPACIASSTSACIRATSSPVAGRSRSAIVTALSVECPTIAVTLTEGGVARSASR
jgi:hypothetical protein